MEQTFLSDIAKNPIDTLQNFYILFDNGYLLSRYLVFNDKKICEILGSHIIQEETYNLQTNLIKKLGIYISNDVFIYSEFFESIKESLYDCGFPDISKNDDYVFCITDPFTHFYLSDLFLSTFFQFIIADAFSPDSKKYYPFIKQYATTVCTNIDNREMNMIYSGDIMKGIKLIEKGALAKFTSTNFKEIFKNENLILFCDDLLRQVLYSLVLMQNQINFSYGGLLAQDVYIFEGPLDVTFHQVHLMNKYQCKIKPNEYMSFTILLGEDNRPFRFFSTSESGNEIDNGKKIYHRPQIYKYNDIYYYQIGNQMSQKIFTELKEIGIPYFIGFDTYSFLSSILCIPSFYNLINNNPKLKEKYWTTLFIDKEDENIMIKRFKEYHKRTSYELTESQLFHLLENIKMRCDITTIIANTLYFTDI